MALWISIRPQRQRPGFKSRRSIIMPFTPIDVVPARPWEYGFKYEISTKIQFHNLWWINITYAWDLGLFKLGSMNARHVGDEPRTQKFKTDTLPPLYHSLTETQCTTVSIVCIRSNKDDQIANTLWWEPVSLIKNILRQCQGIGPERASVGETPLR